MFNLANKPLYALLRLWMSSQDLPCVPDLVCSGNIIMIMLVLTILMIISFSLHGVPYARQEHHGKASANILQIANHHHHHRHHHRHHHCVIFIAIVDFIGITSAATMMIITVHCTRQRGGKANIVQIVQT